VRRNAEHDRAGDDVPRHHRQNVVKPLVPDDLGAEDKQRRQEDRQVADKGGRPWPGRERARSRRWSAALPACGYEVTVNVAACTAPRGWCVLSSAQNTSIVWRPADSGASVYR
jgi:hypothetical protein